MKRIILAIAILALFSATANAALEYKVRLGQDDVAVSAREVVVEVIEPKVITTITESQIDVNISNLQSQIVGIQQKIAQFESLRSGVQVEAAKVRLYVKPVEPVIVEEPVVVE